MSNPSLKGTEEKAGGGGAEEDGGAEVEGESCGRRRTISLMNPTSMDDQELTKQRVRGTPK